MLRRGRQQSLRSLSVAGTRFGRWLLAGRFLRLSGLPEHLRQVAYSVRSKTSGSALLLEVPAARVITHHARINFSSYFSGRQQQFAAKCRGRHSWLFETLDHAGGSNDGSSDSIDGPASSSRFVLERSRSHTTNKRSVESCAGDRPQSPPQLPLVWEIGQPTAAIHPAVSTAVRCRA